MVAHLVPLQRVVGIAIRNYPCGSSRNWLLKTDNCYSVEMACGSRFFVRNESLEMRMISLASSSEKKSFEKQKRGTSPVIIPLL